PGHPAPTSADRWPHTHPGCDPKGQPHRLSPQHAGSSPPPTCDGPGAGGSPATPPRGTASGNDPSTAPDGPPPERVHKHVAGLLIAFSEDEPVSGLAGLQGPQEGNGARLDVIYRYGPSGGCRLRVIGSGAVPVEGDTSP